MFRGKEDLSSLLLDRCEDIEIEIPANRNAGSAIGVATEQLGFGNVLEGEGVDCRSKVERKTVESTKKYAVGCSSFVLFMQELRADRVHACDRECQGNAPKIACLRTYDYECAGIT